MPFALASSFSFLLWPLSELLQSLLWLSVAIFSSMNSSLTICTKPLQQQALLLQLTSPILSYGSGFWQVLVPYLLEPSEHSLGFTLQLFKNTSVLLSSNLCWESSRFCHTFFFTHNPLLDSFITALKAVICFCWDSSNCLQSKVCKQLESNNAHQLTFQDPWMILILLSPALHLYLLQSSKYFAPKFRFCKSEYLHCILIQICKLC